MRKIQYAITFLGEIEMPDDYTDEQVEEAIHMDCLETGGDTALANDIEWEEV